MEIQAEITVQVPADQAWALVGAQLRQIAAWASPITGSSLDGPPLTGAVRICHIRGFGPVPPGVIRERLLSYDPAARSWSDQADRLPWYITRGRCRQSAGHHEQFHLVAHLPGPVVTGAYATKPPQRALTTVAGMRPSARGEDASQPPARRPADVPPAAAGSVAGPQCARHAAAELGAVVSPELARNGRNG